MDDLELASVIALAHTVVGQSNLLRDAVRACTDEAIKVVVELRSELTTAREEVARLRVELAAATEELAAVIVSR